MISTLQKMVMSLALLAGVVSGAHAQSPPPNTTFHTTYGVTDWQELIPEKAAEYRNYRLIVIGSTTYSDDEKAARIARKFEEIRTAVRASRTEAYTAISELRGIGNSATKGNSGGSPKVVEAKCIGGSKEQMYTKPEWARGSYKSGTDSAGPGVIASGPAVDPRILVRSGGAEVCAVRLKQSGEGRKVSYSEATFRIRPERIKAIVDAEMLSIMHVIFYTPI